MKTSQNGIDLIKRFEGLELESYQDIAGIWTIGYGHTGPEVGPDQRLSNQEAEALLRHDLVSREKAVSRLTRVKINQNEFDALISFVYNVGIGAYERSTARRRLNKEDRLGAADALTWFNKATVNGVLREVLGLSRRRAAEKALFITPTEALSSRPENVNDSGRVTPIEDPPRRGSISDSRTIQGATVAGGAGVAASNMGRDASEELDEMETSIEQGGMPVGHGHNNSHAPGSDQDDDADTHEPDTHDDDDGSTEPGDPIDDETSDGSEDNQGLEIPDLEGETDQTPPENQDDTSDPSPDSETPTADDATDTSDETPDVNTETEGSSSNIESAESEGEATGTVVEVPGTPPPAKHQRHEADAQIQFALMIVIILAVLYILFARIDDWFKFRR